MFISNRADIRLDVESSINMKISTIDLNAIRSLDVKREISSYEVDVQEDVKRLRKRDDYSKFGGCHKASTTKFFLPPLLGWRSRAEYRTIAPVDDDYSG